MGWILRQFLLLGCLPNDSYFGEYKKKKKNLDNFFIYSVLDSMQIKARDTIF